MPDVDGFEGARRTRGHAAGRSVILIALSGLTSEADRRAALSAGFDVHLDKPMDVGALLEAVGSA